MGGGGEGGGGFCIIMFMCVLVFGVNECEIVIRH